MTGASYEGLRWGSFCGPNFEQYTSKCTSGHIARVFSLATNPAYPDIVASASEDETIRLWQVSADMKSLRACHSVSPRPDPWLRVSWSEDGSLLAGACSDGFAWVSKFHPEGHVDSGPPEESQGGPLPSLQGLHLLGGHPEEVYACEFLPGRNDRLLTCTSTVVCLWDLEHEPLPKPISMAEGSKVAPDPGVPERLQPGYVFNLAMPPPGGAANPNLIAGACSDGMVRFWARDSNASQVRALAAVKAHQYLASSVRFTRDGNYAVSVSNDGSLSVIDVRKLRLIDSFVPGNGASITHVEAAPPVLFGAATTPTTVIITGAEGYVKVLDPMMRPKEDEEEEEGEGPPKLKPASIEWMTASDKCVKPIAHGAPLAVSWRNPDPVNFKNPARPTLCSAVAMNGDLVLAGCDAFVTPPPPAPKERTRTTVAKGARRVGMEPQLFDFANARKGGARVVRGRPVECIDPSCVDPSCLPGSQPAPMCANPDCADPSCGPGVNPDAPPSERFKGRECPILGWTSEKEMLANGKHVD